MLTRLRKVLILFTIPRWRSERLTLVWTFRSTPSNMCSRGDLLSRIMDTKQLTDAMELTRIELTKRRQSLRLEISGLEVESTRLELDIKVAKQLNVGNAGKLIRFPVENKFHRHLRQHSVHVDVPTNQELIQEIKKPERINKPQKKPRWMSYSLFARSCRRGRPTVVWCAGCAKRFDAIYQSGQRSKPVEYYVHCIEECAEYKKLGLISECVVCKFKYTHPGALEKHFKLSPIHRSE